MPETPSHDEHPASTAELLRRAADHVEHPTPDSLNIDVGHLFEWAGDLERRVTRIEGMTEVVTAIRADVATIAEGVDPALAQHVAELAGTVENHGLLLARLLDDTPTT